MKLTIFILHLAFYFSFFDLIFQHDVSKSLFNYILIAVLLHAL